MKMVDRKFIRGAGIKAGIGAVFAAAAGAWEISAHHAMGNFPTLGEAFFHVTQPVNVAVAVALCIGLGTGIELIMRYNRSQDAAQKEKFPPERPAPKR